MYESYVLYNTVIPILYSDGIANGITKLQLQIVYHQYILNI